VQAGKIVAWLSASFILVANLFNVLLYWGVLTGGEYPNYNEKQYKEMDITTIKSLWAWRRKANLSLMAISILESLGLIMFVYVAFCLAKIHKKIQGMQGAPKVMYWCFILGAVLPAIAFLENLGSTIAGETISEWNIPQQAWISLEISYLISTSRSLYVYALHFFFLTLAFSMTAFLTLMERKLPRFFGYFSACMAALGFIIFITEIIVYNIPSFHGGFAVLLVFWGVISLPVWMFFAGFILDKYSGMPNFAQNEMELNLKPTV